MLSKLLAISADCPISPKINFHNPYPDEKFNKDFVWGMAWYPIDYNAATVVKDAQIENIDALSTLFLQNSNFYSTVFMGHIYGSQQLRAVQDIQPFIRPYAGRDWILVHNGNLAHGYEKSLPLLHSAFETVGATDSEHILCWLLTKLQLKRVRQLNEMNYTELHQWIKDINKLGETNLFLSSGDSMVIYQDENDFNPIYYCRFYPPNSFAYIAFNKIHIEIGGNEDHLRTYMIFSHQPTDGYVWQKLEPGQMLVVSHGRIIWDSLSISQPLMQSSFIPNRAIMPSTHKMDETFQAVTEPQVKGEIVRRTQASQPEQRILHVIHETRYAYQNPVNLSKHSFRLQPLQDSQQKVIDYSLNISVDCRHESFKDVFDNYVTYVETAEPYNELVVRMEAKVALPKSPLTYSSSIRRRTSIPLTWMPWQRQMMTPYLLPAELPESQLEELMDYAMSFVERNDYDVMAVLNDINKTIYHEYSYVSGSTNFSTTAYDVYVTRKGVCQDFSNLFISLARLLGLPARYRSGYIFNGGKYENTEMSDATHAWVEIYLPWIGWVGYDPTNGCEAKSDHIRIACGRNYIDATPTSGTIYRGGGNESLSVSVKVFDITDQHNHSICPRTIPTTTS